MSYAPEQLGYFDTIQVYFLEVTGRGIMFSGRDLELLSRWRSEGASAKTICRGIQEAVASMSDDDPPRGIHACSPWIEAQLESQRERGVGGRANQSGPTSEASTSSEASSTDASNAYRSLFEEALANIERGGRAADSEEQRRVYREAWKSVKTLIDASQVDDPFSELAAVEDALVEGYYRALERAEQSRIEEAITAENRADLAIMSPEARREHLAARRRRFLIKKYGLVPLID